MATRDYQNGDAGKNVLLVKGFRNNELRQVILPLMKDFILKNNGGQMPGGFLKFNVPWSHSSFGELLFKSNVPCWGLHDEVV